MDQVGFRLCPQGKLSEMYTIRFIFVRQNRNIMDNKLKASFAPIHMSLLE